MASKTEHGEEQEARERVGIDRHLAIFVEESSLWPVTLAVVLALTAGGAGLILLAVGDRNIFAVAALLILLWMSVDFLVRRRRFGAVGGFIVALWVLSILGAVAFLALGLF